MTKEKTITQFLNVHKFPFFIKDEKGNELYYESDENYWIRSEYDSNGKQIYSIDSDGYWCKTEYDSDGYLIYSEDNDGIEFDNRPKLEITLKEIAEWKGLKVSQISIKE
jgi:hypothetical protein